MPSILDKIVEQTSADLGRRKQKVSFRDFDSFSGMEKEVRPFGKALQVEEAVSFIAEVKKASPSKGIIRKDFDPVDIALRYEEGGAAAISVLTDEPFFKGSLEYLKDVSDRVQLPLLRKDFIIDPYQIKEARAHGADAVLIIVAITEGQQMDELLHAAAEYNMDALVECYDMQDFKRVNFERVSVLGVNNRDLKNFKVDVHRGIEMLNLAPAETVKVSESGLSSGRDIALLKKHGIDAALIGEYFMRQNDPGKAVSELHEQAEETFEKDFS